jgi:hypothetical protein
VFKRLRSLFRVLSTIVCVVSGFSFLALFAYKHPSERRGLSEKLFVWPGPNYGISPLP